MMGDALCFDLLKLLRGFHCPKIQLHFLFLQNKIKTFGTPIHLHEIPVSYPAHHFSWKIFFLGLPKYKVELKQITGDTVTPGNVQMKLWKCRKYKIQWWESRARWEEEKQMIHWETVEYSVLKSIEEDLLCQTIKGIWSNDTDFVVIERESCHLIRNTKIIFLLFFSYF